MYRLILILISSFLFSCGDQTPDLSDELLKKHWFVRGEFWERDHKASLSTDSLGNHEWSAVFYPENKMKYSSFITQSYTDTAGIVHPVGETFTDTNYRYEIKGDFLKVTKRNDSYYLKLIPSGNNTYEIVSVGETEFR